MNCLYFTKYINSDKLKANENFEFIMKFKNTLIASYRPFLEAIVKLFHPFVEVAVHDLETGKIVAIYHNISQRKVGDKSPLHELGVDVDKFPDNFEPYYKSNWDGRQLKCISITVRDHKGKPVGLICINVDTSFFQDVHRTLGAFLNVREGAENPIELFGGNCQEQITLMIDDYLKEHQLSLAYIKKAEKKELIQHLYHKGALNFKNAPSVIANILKVSRATVYNHIKRISL